MSIGATGLRQVADCISFLASQVRKRPRWPTPPWTSLFFSFSFSFSLCVCVSDEVSSVVREKQAMRRQGPIKLSVVLVTPFPDDSGRRV